MKRVLIVEDSDANRDLLQQILEDEYEVVTAVDGQEGLEAAARHRPDVILLDLSLPVMDGWEVARRLRQDATFDTVPVVAVTAHAMVGDRERAQAAGCDGYITKPIDQDELLRVLGEHCARRRAS